MTHPLSPYVGNFSVSSRILGSSTAGNLSFAVPSTVMGGELLVTWICINGSTAAFVADTSGGGVTWTTLYTAATNGAIYGAQKVSYSWAPSSTIAGSTITVYGLGELGTTRARRAQVFSVANVSTTTPFSAVSHVISGSTNNIYDVAVTSTQESCLAVNLINSFDLQSSIGDFSGETGGDWTQSFIAGPSSANPTASFQSAYLGSTATISGGIVVPSTPTGYSVVAFYLLPAMLADADSLPLPNLGVNSLLGQFVAASSGGVGAPPFFGGTFFTHVFGSGWRQA